MHVLLFTQETAYVINRSSPHQSLLLSRCPQLLLHHLSSAGQPFWDGRKWVWLPSRPVPLPAPCWELCVCRYGDLCPHQKGQVEKKSEDSLLCGLICG